MWRTIKSLLSSSKSSSLPQKLKLVGSVTTDPVLMAEGFNNYFSEVSALLADKIESSKKTLLRFISQKEYLQRSFLTQQILQKFLTSFFLLKPAKQVVMTTFLLFS